MSGVIPTMTLSPSKHVIVAGMLRHFFSNACNVETQEVPVNLKVR
jgi:hypothetical protein